MSATRRAGAGALACILLGAIVALSSAPLRAGDPSSAQLRLSWRAIGERAEACRDRTPEELAQLPAHMRSPRVCERRTLPFELVLAIDGTERISERLIPPGARGDRPVYVDRELRVTPGRHRIALRFAVSGATGAAATAAAVSFDREIEFARAEVALVERDAMTGRFSVRQLESEARVDRAR